MAELRYNPLLGTWTMVAASRQNRPQMPKDWCPFCPGSGKVPDHFDVHKYDNDFPVMSATPPVPDAVGTDFYRTAPSYGACEVILYSPEHDKTLHELPVTHIRKLVDLWSERVNELGKRSEVKYVMPFENKGEEIGVTMPHPHGQIYGYSWVPQRVEVELANARAHHAKTGECLICRMNEEERKFSKRIVFENASFYAYIPFFTDYPYGVFIVAKNHRNYLGELTQAERDDLAEALKVVTGTFDRIFDRPFPYMMAIHQNPVNSPEWDDAKAFYHLHIEFYTPLRAKRLIKYYASSETGGWAAANVAAVEKTSAETRCAKLEYLANSDDARFSGELFKRDFLAEFDALYGAGKEAPAIFASPARINIIGEHIDYNGGLVFPAAIDRYLYLAIRKRNDRAIVYNDLRFLGELRFSIDDKFEYRKESLYANYLNGILTILADRGMLLDSGFEVLFFSTIPSGGGVSSSAALEVGFARAISDLYGFGIDPVDLALIGQESEHRFMNVQCGIMDQFAVAMGKKGFAMALDCATIKHRYVPLELGDARIVVMNTNKKRELADSKYNERLGECRAGLAAIKKAMTLENLCSLPVAKLDEALRAIDDPVVKKRVRHCVTEQARVEGAVAALERGDLATLGKLLGESHVSLRDDYEVTGDELDTLYEEAIAIPGCIGARMTGAGFGGCAIAIVKKDSVKEFIKRVGERYRERCGIEASFFACEPGDGAGRFA
jgi:galactokinase